MYKISKINFEENKNNNERILAQNKTWIAYISKNSHVVLADKITNLSEKLTYSETIKKFPDMDITEAAEAWIATSDEAAIKRFFLPMISFDLKGEVKDLAWENNTKIQWNSNKKMWYWEGRILPEFLKKYHSVRDNVQDSLNHSDKSESGENSTRETMGIKYQDKVIFVFNYDYSIVNHHEWSLLAFKIVNAQNLHFVNNVTSIQDLSAFRSIGDNIDTNPIYETLDQEDELFVEALEAIQKQLQNSNHNKVQPDDREVLVIIDEANSIELARAEIALLTQENQSLIARVTELEDQIANAEAPKANKIANLEAIIAKLNQEKTDIKKKDGNPFKSERSAKGQRTRMKNQGKISEQDAQNLIPTQVDGGWVLRKKTNEGEKMIEFARFDANSFSGTVCWSAYVSDDGIETRTTNGGMGGDIHSLEHLGFEKDENPTHEEIIESWIQWAQESWVENPTDIYLIDDLYDAESGFHLIQKT